MLTEEGYTIVHINVTTPGTVYVLVAHPTCDKVNATLMGGNAEVQATSSLAKGLTQVTIQVYEEGIIEVSLSADPDSSLNPAYVAVIPEFSSVAFLLLALCLGSLTVLLAKTNLSASKTPCGTKKP